ncbi:MAG: hypothetical protein VXY94_02255 [Planctomycetota bacterium]|nr:hypothetical protein [Planctomycetota bacterium]
MADAACPPSGSHENELEPLLERGASPLRSLVDQLPEQATIVGSGDVDAIRELMDRRATVIDSMAVASERIPDLLAAEAPSERASRSIRDTEDLLERLLEADREAARTIERQCSELDHELRRTRAAGTAAQVYQGTSQSPPPARFSDREA